jgi:mannose-6-phosphate isomerase-like protein (cupin superfamily)
VGAGQAISIPPGTPYAVRAAGAPLTAVQIFVPAGPELALRGQPAQDTAPAPARGRRGARLPAVQATPQRYPIAGGQGEVDIYVDRASGHEAASLATLTARPGMRIPAHVHARETEVVLVLAGAGTMTVDGDTYPIAPMTAIQIPPGVEHAVAVEGAEPLRVLQVYTPSGPEQRFKQPPRP